MHRFTIASGELVLTIDDITTLEVDAIVNAANSQLAGGGGVDGAIHLAAGIDDLQAACRHIVDHQGELPTGEAVITPGFALPAPFIIHTVGPIWHDGDQGEPELLRNAYLNSLRLAEEQNIFTIAFPCISCGVYGYPMEKAAGVALTALREGLTNGLVEKAIMVLRDAATLDIWKNEAEHLFG